MNTAVYRQKSKAILQLTRWREHVPYTIPIVVGGALVAVTVNGGQLDWRIIPVVLANILAQAFAYMINDVEDAPDDAREPKKMARNVISNGTLTPMEGTLYTWLTFALALSLFAVGGIWTFALGALQLVLCYLYSAHPFRWKARPVTDVVSHGLMLSALLVMTGYFTYHSGFSVGWLMFGAAFFFSLYGQFFNQLDDYEVDKAAGLRNTVVLIGFNNTKILMYLSLIFAVGFTSIAIRQGVFPSWSAPLALVTIFASLLFTWDKDMRGNDASGSGYIQKPALLLLNIIILSWAMQNIGLFAV